MGTEPRQFPRSILVGLPGTILLATALNSYLRGNADSPPVQFVGIAASAGLRDRVVNGGELSKKYVYESTGSGVAALDYDADGHTDIFLVNGSRLEGFKAGEEPSNHLYRNLGDGTFIDVTARAGLVRSGWGQGVCAGDYDNDGAIDLFVTYYGSPNVLYHNTGRGGFSDASRSAGLFSDGHNWGTGCSFVDYDRDGFLDLFVAGYVNLDSPKIPLPGENEYCNWKGVPVFCGPRGLRAARNHLYRNNHDGTFTDVSSKSGIREAQPCYGLSVVAADFGNRGESDIYVACDSTPSLLFRNRGDGTFPEVGVESGVALSPDGLLQAGMGVSVGDYDGDGWLDILKTNFEGDVPDLYRNNGDGTFTFQTFDAKLGFHPNVLSWGGGFFDFDNDGWPDVFIANGHVYPEPGAKSLASPYRQRNLLYRNLGNGTFDDVTGAAGPGLGLERSGRGAAFADFDDDGDLDLIINNQNDSPTLLRNDGGNRNNFLQVRLLGTRSNRAGIGARVSVLANNRRQFDEVRSGGSYLSQNDLCLHFGLGPAQQVDELTVRWPSGIQDRLSNIPVNQRLLIKEGKGLVQSTPFSREATQAPTDVARP